MEIRSEAFVLQPLEPADTINSAGGHSQTISPAQQAPQDLTSLKGGQMLSGDDLRGNLVQALQSQIGNGSYRVSAQDVASKLLGSMAENQ